MKRAVLLVCCWLLWLSLVSAQMPSGGSISAGNLNVVQNNNGNFTTSVTVTLSAAVNGTAGNFLVRSGSNRGDFTVQVGSSATTNFASGVMMTSVRQLGRDNTAFGDTGYTGIQRATSAIDVDSSGLYIPVHRAPAGDEFNINVAAGYFRYSDGWLGGHLRNAANNGAFTAANSSLNSNIALVTTTPASGSYFLDGTNGEHTLNINASTGNLASANGVLIVTGGKNEDNYALSRANADGSFTVFGKDNGSDGANYEQDGVAFVYIPKDTAGVTSGRVTYTGATTVDLVSGVGSDDAGTASISRVSTGSLLLQIDGVTGENQGVLLISPEGGTSLNVDNIVSYEWNDAQQGWIIETRDLPGMGLQDLDAGVPAFSFVYVPVPEPALLLLMAALFVIVYQRRR